MKQSMFIAAVLLGTTGTATAAGAVPVVGGYAYAYADGNRSDLTLPAPQRGFSTSGSVASATADAGPDARTSARTQSGAWLNRIEITSSANQPNSFVIANAASVFAINQRITGAPGSRPLVSYTFGIDGSFTPGNPNNYPPPSLVPQQGLNFVLLAYTGRALSTNTGTNEAGGFLDLVTTNGTIRTGAGAGNFNTITQPPISGGFAFLCPGAGTRCAQGGSFNETKTISFALDVNTDYFVVGFLSSDTNGDVDFFNTAKLESIELAPEFGLESEDGGALRRNANGSFVLAVPEPASWMMLITGFGLAGAAMRRRPAPGVRTAP